MDVVLAAKDGWDTDVFVELCATLRLPGAADASLPLEVEPVEVEILRSDPEVVEDSTDSGEVRTLCWHPSELRIKSCETAEWRTWRARPTEPPHDEISAKISPPNPKRRRGSKNTHWHKVKKDTRSSLFAAALVREFGIDRLRRGTGVVDVAGGSGELSFELSVRWGVPCTIVDPRGAGVKLTSRHRRLLASRAANAARISRDWERISPLARSLAKKWAGYVPSSVRHIKRWFDERLMDDPEARWILQECSAVVGLHPDQATGAIVDCGLVMNKPWAVVPCCVFPSMFPTRINPATGEQVRTVEDLVQHLLGRADNAQARRCELSCEGANTVVFCCPSDDNVDSPVKACRGREDWVWPDSILNAKRGPFQLPVNEL